MNISRRDVIAGAVGATVGAGALSPQDSQIGQRPSTLLRQD